MFFRWNGKKYTVNVNKVFLDANQEDYRFDDIEENGVVIKDFEGHEDFTGCNVCIFYNPTKEQVTIQLEKEEYEIIGNPYCSSEEIDIISSELSD